MRTFLLVFLIIPVMALSQQTFKVSGKILNDNNQLATEGSVHLISAQNQNTVANTNVRNGEFLFESVTAGDYVLQVFIPGSATYEQPLSVSAEMNLNVVVKRKTSALKEVTIVGQKKAISIKDGNIILNTENPSLASIADPLELMGKLPGVLLSPDRESMSVIGKGTPIIYIDNQRVSMNDLKSLAVTDIKSVELVNNPSSKYDADGRVVILITRKFSMREGFKMDLNHSLAVRRYLLNRNSANFSLRKNKWEFRTTLQYNRTKTWEGNAFLFEIPRHSILSEYDVEAITHRPQYIADLGAYCQINDKDYFSISSTSRIQNEYFDVDTRSYFADPTKQENIVTDSHNDQPIQYHTAKLNYQRKHRKGNGSLFVGGQYTTRNMHLNSSIFDQVNAGPRSISQLREQTSGIDSYSGRLDFEQTNKKGLKIEAGAVVTHATSDGTSMINTAVETIGADFTYRESNLAGYAQISGKKKKLEYAAGMRFEDTKANSSFNDNRTNTDAQYNSTNWFPRASASVSIDSTKSAGLRYSKTINRPNYSNANQTTVYINPYFEWANNINLQPSINQELTANFSYKDYSVAVTFFETSGAVNADFSLDEQRLILRRSDVNYEKERGYSLSLTIPYRYKIWNSTNVINVINTRLIDDRTVDRGTSPFVYAQTTNEIRLPSNFLLNVSAWLVTKSRQGAIERNALYAVDTSLTKSFGKHLTCTLRYNDIFASVNPREAFEINAVAANGVFFDNGRELSIALKYALGKLKDTRYRSREVDESGSRVR
jgi:hypothetical protein